MRLHDSRLTFFLPLFINYAKERNAMERYSVEKAMKILINNPFCYGKTVDTPYFFGREKELEEILLSMRNAAHLILYSPRRNGKSSLVLKALKELKAEGHPTVYIDFFKVTSREKFIELYAREVVRPLKNWTRTLKRLQGMVRGIQPSMGMDGSGMPELRLSVDPLHVASAFEDIINIPAATKQEKCWIVVFDEFQEVEKLNGDSFEKELRARLQHHTNVSYVFLGSQRHLLMNMFSRKDRAFYNFGKLIRLQKPREDESLRFLTERFTEGGFPITGDLGRMIIEQTRNIPYYLQYLASEIWEYSRLSEKTPEEVHHEALERILINQSDYFQGLRSQLTSFQTRLLTAVATNGSGSYETGFLQKYRLFPTSSIQKAYHRLTELDILEKTDSRFTISDPFFERWLKSQG